MDRAWIFVGDRYGKVLERTLERASIGTFRGDSFSLVFSRAKTLSAAFRPFADVRGCSLGAIRCLCSFECDPELYKFRARDAPGDRGFLAGDENAWEKENRFICSCRAVGHKRSGQSAKIF